MLSGKKIILGVTGSIAAYKSALIVRELITSGAEVKVIMTDASRDFITPLTLSTLSKNPVLYRFTDDPESGEWNNHVDLGLWADAMVIAPSSANTMGKMVQGICDNLLMATYLSARCKVFVAPAMDLDMYAHESTQENLRILEERGVYVIQPEEGELASGLIGKGRMAEPEEIRKELAQFFNKGVDLSGKQIMVSAGPTYEDLDPVRFLGNRSTGKMGFALARTAAELGAQVTLIAGPVNLSIDHPNIQRKDVRSAAEMYEACTEVAADSDIIIMAAAVADFTPRTRSDKKIKKGDDGISLELVRTKDILAHLGAERKDGQVIVGFALESNNALDNAKSKLERKGLDMIVLNTLEHKGAGFAHDTNKVTILTKDNKQSEFELKSKDDVAFDILQQIYNYQR